ncbi:MAG: SMI1/KNR4 family protein [Scytonematopsis contorta HA4267-MV1]|jgi:hypothetical protein|nr:SMI1/KNR4 family protein [Scytonematopsis contorta HA4267-MV1]
MIENFDWQNLIRQRVIKEMQLRGTESNIKLSPEIFQSRYFSYPCATEEQIVSAEARLGVTFPYSYREFLKVTNGFRCPNGLILLSTEEVDWFCVNHQMWIDIWTENIEDTPSVSDELYFNYWQEQSCCDLRKEYMQTAIQISNTFDGFIYLLNPQVVTNDGEWEAWDFGNKYPGAKRYKSFWEMMRFELLKNN